MALSHLEPGTFDKKSFRSVVFAWTALAILLWAPHAVSSQETKASPATPPADDAWFEDLAPSTGLTFTHFNGMTGQFWFPEMTGQGGAILDYDGDGDLDLYLVQGSLLGNESNLDEVLFPPPREQRLSDRLYRNDATFDADGTRGIVFVDVTEDATIDAPGYGMGAAVGDFDGDGWPDLYITNYGPNQLLRNRGDGTFEDVTAASGTGDPLWGTSATFFDYDGDGDADLYVVNYVTFDIDKNPRCFAPSSRRDYCGPDAFDAQPDRLFENRGGGIFEDVTSRVLVGYEAGPGLGVMAADFNGDGLEDLYVANDGRVNQLWIHQDNGTYLDDALFAGVAVNAKGRSEASMGIDAADFDGDGDEDIFLTHLMGETNTLYLNDGSGLFKDWTVESGMASLSLPYTSFGTAWIDFDNDGGLDLMAANGAVRILEDQAAAGDPYPLKQPNQLFKNVGGHFNDASSMAGAALSTPLVSRGLSIGDLDNDGDVDVVVHNNNGSTQLLVNRFGARQP
ncbi:MAG: VCBS repeat-containing protein [Acidobacteriota bacterium]